MQHASQNLFVKGKGRLPSLPFSNLKDRILGKKYSLGVAFITAKEIGKLNQAYRKKNKPTDILAFPLSRHEGEIVVCLSETKKKAKLFQQPFKKYLPFLLIHGMLHLKGHKHGKIMEKLELKWVNYFNF